MAQGVIQPHNASCLATPPDPQAGQAVSRRLIIGRYYVC